MLAKIHCNACHLDDLVQGFMMIFCQELPLFGVIVRDSLPCTDSEVNWWVYQILTYCVTSVRLFSTGIFFQSEISSLAECLTKNREASIHWWTHATHGSFPLLLLEFLNCPTRIWNWGTYKYRSWGGAPSVDVHQTFDKTSKSSGGLLTYSRIQILVTGNFSQ